MLHDGICGSFQNDCWAAISDPIWTTNGKYICYHPLIKIYDFSLQCELKQTNPDSILNLSKSKKKKKIIKLLDDIAYLFFFHMVHWSFILGKGWLLSNRFCKACQNCFRPSFTQCSAVAWIVALLWKLPQMPSCKRKYNSDFDTHKKWHVLQNWLLCHPWPNMNEQCSKWK